MSGKSEGSYHVAWEAQKPGSESLANLVYITEAICTPFSLRQFERIGLLPPIDSHPRVLDNACGSGRQTELLRKAYQEAGKEISIECCDISPGMISSVEKRIKEGNWQNVRAHVVNAEVDKLPGAS
jgi:SAM-dependent methyltransferase